MLSTIEFHNVLPHPLRDSPIGNGFWKAHTKLSSDTFYLIVADSGKGKSTLLNIIYGTRKDYEGIVTIDDRNIATMDESQINQLRSAHFAYLFQDLRLFGNLTARENISMKPGFKFENASIQHWASKLGVENLLDRRCNTLSLGQQQRIAMIRALSQPFKWLLLDEPFSHLDNNNAAAMMELISMRCKEENAGIIATSLGDKRGFEEFHSLAL